MRTLALTILTMGIVLTTGHVRAQTYNPAFPKWGQRRPWQLRPDQKAGACKGANGAIPAIANSPATPNAWPPRAVRAPLAVNCRYALRAPAARSR